MNAGHMGLPTPGRAYYFAEINQHAADDLAGVLRRDAEDVESRVVQQLAVLSQLVSDKYRRTQWSLGVLATGFMLVGVAAIVSLTS